MEEYNPAFIAGPVNTGNVIVIAPIPSIVIPNPDLTVIDSA